MAPCNLCGGSRQATLEAAGGTRVVRCDCGLVSVTPVPPRGALAAAYDAAYYDGWAGQEPARRRIWRARLRRVTRLAGSPGRLLDVGCGTGTFLQAARRAGWDVHGTELSPYAVKAAAAGGLPVVEGEVWEAGFPPATFDLVTCWHVLEHAVNPRAVVAEMYRVLRPGGFAVLATPNVDDRIFRAAYRLARRHAPPLYEPDEREIHLFHFSAATLRRLLTLVGFEVLEVGFDRGAAATWEKRLVEAVALTWFRLTGWHWGLALEAVARTPSGPRDGGRR